ncbi:hypothetical protein, partial [Streptomyces glaucescens]|uniref:hypothetical protein n=1 Tax=Streptomyces glaucescens TaxID=1907 RepID=UPI003BB62248
MRLVLRCLGRNGDRHGHRHRRGDRLRGGIAGRPGGLRPDRGLRGERELPALLPRTFLPGKPLPGKPLLTGRNRPTRRHGLPRRHRLPRLSRLVLVLRPVGRPVRVGRRQGEHRARPGLLRRRALLSRGQGPATAPRRLRVLLRRGGQRGRQGVLLLGAAVGAPAIGRGDALRRNGPAQAGARGRGARGVLVGGDDGALGHP